MTGRRPHDLVLAGGRVVDGCGNPWYRGDIGVRDGRIAEIGSPRTLGGSRVVDAGDRYVAPGFVDPHTHSDLSVMVYRDADTAVRQGVTTQVVGNCGMSPAPLTEERRADVRLVWDEYGQNDERVSWRWRGFNEYLVALAEGGVSLNLTSLVGHGTLRAAVMGFEPRPPSTTELERMKRLLEESMAAGAFGLSTGLVYPPGCYAETGEIVALCRVVARHHGIYTTHVRGERETLLAAVAEAIDIGRRAGVAVQVSHNAPKWGAPGSAAANLDLIAQARREGQDVTADNDVHTDLAPRLSRALPPTLHDLSASALLDVLRDPQRRAALRRDVVEERRPGAGYAGLLRHGAYDRIVVLHAPRQPHLEGLSVAAVAEGRGADPFDTFLDLIIEEEDRVVGIFDYIDPANIAALLRHPLTMCCSDGFVAAPPDEAWTPDLYWPCCYGEYPGILERFVRDDPVLSLEEAVRKMTSFPAQRFGLADRGVLRPGMCADVVVFDLDRLRDRATNPYPHGKPFANIPPRYPEGIDYVCVNGELVIDDGQHTGTRSGRVLRHSGP
jgi:N-acyl-D-amino-acid deacylase